MTYKAWSLSDKGRSWIEDYDSVDDAVGDILAMWPEDNSDVEIVDEEGETVALMVRGLDPAVCHVYESGKPTGSFRCAYRRNNKGLVETVVSPLLVGNIS